MLNEFGVVLYGLSIIIFQRGSLQSSEDEIGRMLLNSLYIFLIFCDLSIRESRADKFHISGSLVRFGDIQRDHNEMLRYGISISVLRDFHKIK